MSITLRKAREDMRERVLSGGQTTCPCCGRFQKRYNRKLHAEMTSFLQRLVELYKEGREWIHVRHLRPRGAKASTDGSYLVWWGLVEPQMRDNGTRRDGYYRPTQDGIDFVDGKIKVPSYIQLYNQELVGQSGTFISIDEAVPFDKEEL